MLAVDKNLNLIIDWNSHARSHQYENPPPSGLLTLPPLPFGARVRYMTMRISWIQNGSFGFVSSLGYFVSFSRRMLTRDWRVSTVSWSMKVETRIHDISLLLITLCNMWLVPMEADHCQIKYSPRGDYPSISMLQAGTRIRVDRVVQLFSCNIEPLGGNSPINHNSKLLFSLLCGELDASSTWAPSSYWHWLVVIFRDRPKDSSWFPHSALRMNAT